VKQIDRCGGARRADITTRQKPAGCGAAVGSMPRGWTAWSGSASPAPIRRLTTPQHHGNPSGRSDPEEIRFRTPARCVQPSRIACSCAMARRNLPQCSTWPFRRCSRASCVSQRPGPPGRAGPFTTAGWLHRDVEGLLSPPSAMNLPSPRALAWRRQAAVSPGGAGHFEQCRQPQVRTRADDVSDRRVGLEAYRARFWRCMAEAGGAPG